VKFEDERSGCAQHPQTNNRLLLGTYADREVLFFEDLEN
jgi:hypothetical protein